MLFHKIATLAHLTPKLLSKPTVLLSPFFYLSSGSNTGGYTGLFQIPWPPSAPIQPCPLWGHWIQSPSSLPAPSFAEGGDYALRGILVCFNTINL